VSRRVCGSAAAGCLDRARLGIALRPIAGRIDSTNFVTGCLIADVTVLVMVSQICFPFHLEDQLLDAFLAPHFKSTLERAKVLDLLLTA
jgi:hypothetical protein